MQAVILAAGNSTRTYPLTLTRPKCLLKVANKTILEHNLEQLEGLFDEVVLVVGYRKEMIMEKLGNNFHGMKITYVEQKEQLGTFHAAVQARDMVKGKFLLMMGDDIYDRKDVESLLKHDNCVLAKKIADPSRFGVLVLKDGNVERVVEKPEEFVSDLANAGMYVFGRGILDAYIGRTKRGELEVTDAINDLAKAVQIKCETVKGRWLSICYPWDVLAANEELLMGIGNDIKGVVEPNATIKGNVAIGRNTVVKNGSYIEGPAVIGEDCTIGPNCYIRPYTSIGDNCKIGNAVEVKNCVIMDGVSMGHLSYFGDSVIGSQVNIGGGSIVANLRHDNEPIRMFVKGQRVETGRKKLGTIIGDNVHLGMKTAIYPGRSIWAHKATMPCEVVKADVV
ncbi:MAG: NTP transferase domain-containing protein [Candidatus Aenigmarchaeota archaeon]|nr:NTP transferase domain-containing protein [Candidatus Aenigmarchaeota archaeon]